MTKSLGALNYKVTRCKKCPRLASYIRQMAKTKVKQFSEQKYWGKPLPSFGDPNAQLLIVGLAPAAHGGNRTGRMFTGDSSGDWLAKALFENGFANKPTSTNINDGFVLVNSYITAAVRCAPPENMPTKEEITKCSQFLGQELVLLKNIRVIVCLGKIAFDTVSKLVKIKEKFSHGKQIKHKQWIIVCSYHPSRQNTQTGRLTWVDWNKIFSQTKQILN
jgi:uracil-DNA glycosylase family 4